MGSVRSFSRTTNFPKELSTEYTRTIRSLSRGRLQEHLFSALLPQNFNLCPSPLILISNPLFSLSPLASVFLIPGRSEQGCCKHVAAGCTSNPFPAKAQSTPLPLPLNPLFRCWVVPARPRFTNGSLDSFFICDLQNIKSLFSTGSTRISQPLPIHQIKQNSWDSCGGFSFCSLLIASPFYIIKFLPFLFQTPGRTEILRLDSCHRFICWPQTSVWQFQVGIHSDHRPSSIPALPRSFQSKHPSFRARQLPRDSSIILGKTSIILYFCTLFLHSVLIYHNGLLREALTGMSDVPDEKDQGIYLRVHFYRTLLTGFL